MTKIRYIICTFLIISIMCCLTGCLNSFSGNTTVDNVTPVSTAIPVPKTPEPVLTQPVVAPTPTPVIPTATQPIPVAIPTEVPVVIPAKNDNNLTISFINIGQGDAELVMSPSGKSMLIDTGIASEVGNITSLINKTIPAVNNTTSIDMIVVTHPHSDHIGGIDTILPMYTINTFVDSGYKYSSAMYLHMMKLVTDNKNITYKSVKSGDRLNLDPAINISILNPQEKFFNELNDNSVVMLIKYKNVSFLMTGDAGLNAEAMYVPNLNKVDIMKVSHHGSDTGTGIALLSKAKPTISIIPVGNDNSYGHPDKSTLIKLKAIGTKIYRTDQNGTVVVTTNGEQYSVSTNN